MSHLYSLILASLCSFLQSWNPPHGYASMYWCSDVPASPPFGPEYCKELIIHRSLTDSYSEWVIRNSFDMRPSVAPIDPISLWLAWYFTISCFNSNARKRMIIRLCTLVLLTFLIHVTGISADPYLVKSISPLSCVTIVLGLGLFIIVFIHTERSPHLIANTLSPVRKEAVSNSRNVSDHSSPSVGLSFLCFQHLIIYLRPQ